MTHATSDMILHLCKQDKSPLELLAKKEKVHKTTQQCLLLWFISVLLYWKVQVVTKV